MNTNAMKILGRLFSIALVGATVFFATGANAQATIAGTVINNEATVSFVVDGVATTRVASVDFTVQEIIDVTVTWVDGTNVFADTPEVDAVSQYEVANIGNGTEDFVLSVNNSADPDQFDFTLPGDVEIYIDDPVNGTPGVFDVEDDLFVTSTTIAPESTITVFVVADVPTGLVQGDEGLLDLTVASNTAGAAGSPVGTTLAGLGDAGTDAIVGSTLATSTATATYEISTVDVTLTKTVLSVSDVFGGSQYLPGSRVVYRIALTVADGTAAGLVLSDPIPANTTYVAESIDLNGVDVTDAAGDDEADYNITTPGAITVDLGDVLDGSAYTIDLSVIVD